MIFVDTGAWFASVAPWDADHRAAADWFRRNREPLLTTDYIVDETLTLLRSRGEAARALALGQQFFAGTIATVHRLTESEIRQTWDVFRRYSDKAWSFTDCTSKVILENFGLTQAFAFDHHFTQFGSITVVP